MAHGDGGGPSASRRRRRMRAQFARCIRRSRSRAGSDNLDLIPRPGGEQGPSTLERLKVCDAAVGGESETGSEKGRRGTSEI